MRLTLTSHKSDIKTSISNLLFKVSKIHLLFDESPQKTYTTLCFLCFDQYVVCVVIRATLLFFIVTHLVLGTCVVWYIKVWDFSTNSFQFLGNFIQSMGPSNCNELLLATF